MGYTENTNDLALPNTLIVGNYVVKATNVRTTKGGKYDAITFQVVDPTVKTLDGRELTNTGVTASTLILRAEHFDSANEQVQHINEQTVATLKNAVGLAEMPTSVFLSTLDSNIVGKQIKASIKTSKPNPMTGESQNQISNFKALT